MAININGTGSITGLSSLSSPTISGGSLPAGSASAPGLVFSGDSNTGLYSPGADQVAISTNGTGRLFVDSSGRIGLGGVEGTYAAGVTTTGNNGLLVRTGTSSADQIYVGNTAGEPAVGTLTADPLNIITNGSTRIRITDAGLVGLGTSTPGGLFHVGPSGAGVIVDNTYSELSPPSSGNDSYVFRSSNDGSLNFSSRPGAGGRSYRFWRGSNVSMIIDDSGRLGIGTAPSSLLDVRSGSSPNAANLLVGLSGSNNYFVANNNIFQDGASNEKARIDSSGRLLVGTSSSISNVYVGGASYQSPLQVIGNAAGYGNGLTQINYSADGYGSVMSLGSSKNATIGSNGTLASGDDFAILNFIGNDGTNFRSGAYIIGTCDGTVSTGSVPGRLSFWTTATAASSPTERMRINNAGRLMIGGTTATSGSQAVFFQVGESTDYCHIERSGPSSVIEIVTSVSTTAARNQYSFKNPNGTVGNIQTSGSSTSFLTSSDYRLKENVIPLTGAISRVNQLQVHRFNFIADPDKIVDGFLAHEAQEVVPECATGTKDEVDADGNPVYQGIDQSKLVPLLTAALQEALTEIESLKSRVTALEP